MLSVVWAIIMLQIVGSNCIQCAKSMLNKLYLFCGPFVFFLSVQHL
uniref:Uncharacterized protein n=1 Tax=Rhizophora mucronata TaxID=61149 RepID=A0A2P2Q461_RHIMU